MKQQQQSSLDRHLDAFKCGNCGKIGCMMKSAKVEVIEGVDDDEIGIEYLPDWEFGCQECVDAEFVDID